jgi:multimeric flavodoxin WrbA
MKILGIAASPNKKGNTVLLLTEALKGAKQEGAQIELFSVAGKTIAPCDNCGACHKTDECAIKDDMQELYDKLLEADGIIFGTPVYFYNMTAQLKAIIDRTIGMNRPGKSLANKVGAAVVTGGSLGIADTLKDIYFYFVTRQMIPANFVAAYPVGEGGLKKMDKCMKAAEDLGRQMVKIAAQKFEYPRDVPSTHIAYGTHTR